MHIKARKILIQVNVGPLQKVTGEITLRTKEMGKNLYIYFQTVYTEEDTSWK